MIDALGTGLAAAAASADTTQLDAALARPASFPAECDA